MAHQKIQAVQGIILERPFLQLVKIGQNPSKSYAPLRNFCVTKSQNLFQNYFTKCIDILTKCLHIEINEAQQTGEFIMTTITITNPFSGAIIEHDITDLTEQQLEAYVNLMDDEIREAIHAELSPCSPQEFLAAYVSRVGSDEAGKVILGS